MSLAHPRRLWVAAGILAALILIGFALSVPHTRDSGKLPTPVASAPSVPVVALKDSYKKGVHTITGTVQASDACSTVSASAIPEGSASSTNAIQVQITLPADSGICLQVPTPMTFSTSIAAPPGIVITATVNGVLASTTPL